MRHTRWLWTRAEQKIERDANLAIGDRNWHTTPSITRPPHLPRNEIVNLETKVVAAPTCPQIPFSILAAVASLVAQNRSCCCRSNCTDREKARGADNTVRVLAPRFFLGAPNASLHSAGPHGAQLVPHRYFGTRWRTSARSIWRWQRSRLRCVSAASRPHFAFRA